VGEHQVDQRAALVVERRRGLGVGDGGVDLGHVADDGGVGQQAGPVVTAVGGHLVHVEAVERRPEAGPLAEDGQPGQPGLERLQRQQLEQGALVTQRPAPLVVVVGDVQGIADAPSAAAAPVVAHNQIGHHWDPIDEL
jgi:hypothetical protein